MENVGFPVDDIKLELELEDEKRTFTIGNISKTRPNCKILNKIIKNSLCVREHLNSKN